MFKKGDIVIGLPDNDYRVTGHGSISEVLEIHQNGRMLVRVIRTGNPYVNGDYGAKYVGQIYVVKCSGFVLEKGNVNQVVVGLLRKGDVFK